MATANSYVQDTTGTYIPATQRPDGSWRKARRVKDGYIPQDEMPLYESKGKQWAKNRPTMPVGLDPCYVAANIQKNSSNKKIPGLSEVNNSETNIKSTKKKKKKSKKADITTKMVDLDISNNSNDVQTVTVTTNNSTKSQPITTDPVKRIRNLKKKLRDIKALKLKIESGELASPDKDQLEKISRQGEFEAEIEGLELELESS